MPSMYTCSPRTLKKNLVICMNAGLTPFVTSSPGTGKSDIVREIAKEYNLEVIDIRLSQCASEDLQGLPKFEQDKNGIQRARFIPFDLFPLEGTPLPKGKSGFILFLDEMNSAPRSIQAAA